MPETTESENYFAITLRNGVSVKIYSMAKRSDIAKLYAEDQMRYLGYATSPESFCVAAFEFDNEEVCTVFHKSILETEIIPALKRCTEEYWGCGAEEQWQRNFHYQTAVIMIYANAVFFNGKMYFRKKNKYDWFHKAIEENTPPSILILMWPESFT